MAKQKRPISFGTYLMLIIVAITVGMSAWVLPRIAGDLEDITIDTAALIHALAATAAPSGAAPIAEYHPATDIDVPAEPTPAPPPAASSVTISVGGQIWLDSTLRKSGLQEAGAYHYDDIFETITPYMNGADVTMVTLESTISMNESYDTYRAPEAILGALKNAGVDIINLATERILEEGLDGLAHTRTIAEKYGFDVTGANRSADEQALPLTFELNGIKIAVLSYTYGLSTAGAKVGTKEDRQAAVNLIDAQSIRDDVRLAREQGANLVLINTHWGKRSNTKPPTDITRLVDEIADCGADAILGTHPTTVHKMERRSVLCADGVQRDVFIAYSLGDFLVNERGSSDEIIGMLLTLQFTLDPDSASARLTDAKYLPTWQMRWQPADKYYYRILPAGTTQQPSEMTNTVYRSMRRAYEDLIKKIGSDAAMPISE
ncbi:MAG: CapA family protein [Oscillospiraceae bacterium]|jgi:poly-gamma-glutamate synthesis protein (capsule biosynthesis protein)|nr:CapA family protein [Oscillospiraceae bacterium]